MSRGLGDQVWPRLRRIIGRGSDPVSVLETDKGRLLLEGGGVRKRADGRVTISGSNIEHDATTGRIRILGESVQ